MADFLIDAGTMCVVGVCEFVESSPHLIVRCPGMDIDTATAKMDKTLSIDGMARCNRKELFLTRETTLSAHFAELLIGRSNLWG